MLFKANYTYTKYDHAFAPMDIGDQVTRNTTNNKMIDHEDLFMIRGQYMF